MSLRRSPTRSQRGMLLRRLQAQSDREIERDDLSSESHGVHSKRQPTLGFAERARGIVTGQSQRANRE